MKSIFIEINGSNLLKTKRFNLYLQKNESNLLLLEKSS